jgi:hypothetical protein
VLIAVPFDTHGGPGSAATSIAGLFVWREAGWYG